MKCVAIVHRLGFHAEFYIAKKRLPQREKTMSRIATVKIYPQTSNLKPPELNFVNSNSTWYYFNGGTHFDVTGHPVRFNLQGLTQTKETP